MKRKQKNWIYCILSYKLAIICFLLGALTLAPSLMAQTPGKTKVTGFVQDSKGDAIIGASVKVKDASIGTITDVNGRYILNDISKRYTDIEQNKIEGLIQIECKNIFHIFKK